MIRIIVVIASIAVAILIAFPAVSAFALAAVTAAPVGGVGNSIVTIDVNCNSGKQLVKHITGKEDHGNVVVTGSITINCGSGGGGVGPKGDTGAPGKNGQNATVTFLTEPLNSTSTTHQFNTKHFSCVSIGLAPFKCVKK